jgi:hypothetical protein
VTFAINLKDAELLPGAEGNLHDEYKQALHLFKAGME